MGAVAAPILILVLVIGVHELGHLIAAKLAGVHVSRAAIGFGPPLFRRRFGETEYVVGLLPLGGYVRMASRFDVTPAESTSASVPESAQFESKPLAPRLFVLLAGVAMNLLLAIVLFAVLTLRGDLAFASSVGPERQTLDSPGLAGLGIGDTIRAVNGHVVSTWTEVTERVAESQGDVAITMDQGVAWFSIPSWESPAGFAELLWSEICPIADSVVALASDVPGPAAAAEGAGAPAETSRALPAAGSADRIGLGAAVTAGSQVTWEVTGEVARFVRDVSVGDRSIREVRGLITIVRAAAGAAEGGLADVLLLTALLSVNLAVLNLLPIPPLDGGQITVAIIESASGRPVGRRMRIGLALAGLALILALFVLATYNDVLGVLDGSPVWGE